MHALVSPPAPVTSFNFRKIRDGHSNKHQIISKTPKHTDSLVQFAFKYLRESQGRNIHHVSVIACCASANMYNYPEEAKRPCNLTDIPYLQTDSF